MFLQDIKTGQMCITDAGTTQDNFVLPALPVGGLPTSQDWIDSMKRVPGRINPNILSSGKIIVANYIFKLIIGYTNLSKRQLQCRLGSRVCFFVTSNVNMAGYLIKYIVFIKV